MRANQVAEAPSDEAAVLASLTFEKVADATSAEWFQARLAVAGHAQGSRPRLMKNRGDNRNRKAILRSIQRIATGRAEVGGHARRRQRFGCDARAHAGRSGAGEGPGPRAPVEAAAGERPLWLVRRAGRCREDRPLLPCQDAAADPAGAIHRRGDPGRAAFVRSYDHCLAGGDAERVGRTAVKRCRGQRLRLVDCPKSVIHLRRAGTFSGLWAGSGTEGKRRAMPRARARGLVSTGAVIVRQEFFLYCVVLHATALECRMHPLIIRALWYGLRSFHQGCRSPRRPSALA